MSANQPVSINRAQTYNALTLMGQQLFDQLYGSGVDNYVTGQSPLRSKWEPIILGFDENIIYPGLIYKLIKRYELPVPKMDGNPSEAEYGFYSILNGIVLDQQNLG